MLEERRAEPDRDRELGRVEALRFARVSRRRIEILVCCRTLDQLPGGHRCRGLGPYLEQIYEISASGTRQQVERCEVQPVLSRRADAGLVVTKERDRPASWRGRDRLVACGRPPYPYATCKARGGTTRDAEQFAPRDAGGVRHRRTTVLTWLSGSDSPSTDCASLRTSLLVSLS